MTTIHAKGISRRGWLRWTAILGVAVALPSRVWAAVARPEAAFGATALDDALAALGDAPQMHEGIQFTTPDIAENGAVVPIRVEVDSEALPNVSKVSVLVEMNPNPLAASYNEQYSTKCSPFFHRTLDAPRDYQLIFHISFHQHPL